MRPGERIGVYEIEERLGAGGMGAVFRVVHVPTGARRALKLLTGPADERALARFLREGQAMAAVAAHPNVVRVHDAGASEGKPYLVMELCTGGDLTGRLRAQGPLAPDEAARLVAEVARGLAHVHAHGIVHRDIKPQNVLFDDQGRPRITDFGIAHVAEAATLTATGGLVGTPAYMAPEQASGRHVDARADVWALGGLLIAALTGRAPYEGDNEVNIVFKVVTQEPRWPSADRADTPPDLEAIVRRAMARRRMDRYPSAAALADDLERFLRGEPLAPTPRPPRWPWAAAAAGILLIAGAGVAARPRDPGSSAPPAASDPTSATSTTAATGSATPLAADATGPAERTRGAPMVRHRFLAGQTAWGLAFLDDRHVLATTGQRLWRLDLLTGKEQPVADVERGLGPLARAGDRLFSMDDARGLVELHLPRGDEPLRVSEVPVDGKVRDLYAGGGVLAALLLDCSVRVFERPGAAYRTLTDVHERRAEVRWVGVAVSPSGRHLALGLSGSTWCLVQVFSIDGRLADSPRWSTDDLGGERRIREVGFFGDDQLLVAIEGGDVVRLRVEDGRRLTPLRHASDYGQDAALEPLAGAVVGAPRARPGSVVQLVSAPGDPWLWTASWSEVWGWQLSGDGEVTRRHVVPQPSHVGLLRLSPDGRRLLVARTSDGVDLVELDP